ncbi:hypothetical protein [Kocuria sp. CNJ-770]|uniref:hypothetical protein n=1 Tax=Kocuria sp. CNJ-770 TaxID=1904964 RepID=UPI0013017BE9|nr:hypothetical protein [Kocuria sp. CNJ-770]
MAATTAWWAGVTTDRAALVPANVVAGALSGVTVLALSDASERLDARIMGRLEAAGVRHPRRWVAATSLASVLVGYAVDRAGARAATQALEVEENPVRTRALTPVVREVVRGILQATDSADAQVLLGQLAVAQESFFDDDLEGFSATVEFQVPEDVVRVVPHHQTYPVQARYQAADGTVLQIRLQVMEGKLSHLAIDFADEAHYEDEEAIDVVEELIDQWPAPADLRYVREGPDGQLLPVT